MQGMNEAKCLNSAFVMSSLRNLFKSLSIFSMFLSPFSGVMGFVVVVLGSAFCGGVIRASGVSNPLMISASFASSAWVFAVVDGGLKVGKEETTALLGFFTAWG